MTQPELAGSDDDALLQALRNLWPHLSPTGRTTATTTATTITQQRDRR